MNRIEAIELLEFYALAGVDILIDEEPHNRFEEPAQSKVAEGVPKVSKPSPVASPAPQVAPMEPASSMPERPAPAPQANQLETDFIPLAKEAAAAATNLSELTDAFKGFEGCTLKHTAKNFVFCEGAPTAKFMIIGETPGRDEDISGQPFAGRNRQLLHKILASIGLNRDQTLLANFIPWRPPGKRAPTAQEADICRPFAERLIELAQPNYLILLGSSGRRLLGGKEGVLKSRGKWLDFSPKNAETKPIATMTTLHPEQLLAQPLQKKLVWHDMLMLKSKLTEDGFYE